MRNITIRNIYIPNILVRLAAHRRLILLAVLVAVGIGALFCQTIWSIRNTTWGNAERAGANLAYTLAQSIDTLLMNLDPSLQGLAKNLADPRVMALEPALRDRVLFDHSLRVDGLSAVMVLDAQGQRILDSGGLPPGAVDFSDRDYFRAFQSEGRQGLFIGKPIESRRGPRRAPPGDRRPGGPPRTCYVGGGGGGGGAVCFIPHPCPPPPVGGRGGRAGPPGRPPAPGSGRTEVLEGWWRVLSGWTISMRGLPLCNWVKKAA